MWTGRLNFASYSIMLLDSCLEIMLPHLHFSFHQYFLPNLYLYMLLANSLLLEYYKPKSNFRTRKVLNTIKYIFCTIAMRTFFIFLYDLYFFFYFLFGKKNNSLGSWLSFIRYDWWLASLPQSSSLNFLTARICRIADALLKDAKKILLLSSRTYFSFNGTCSIGLIINELCPL